MIFCRLLFFQKYIFFEKFFQEYDQTVCKGEMSLAGEKLKDYNRQLSETHSEPTMHSLTLFIVAFPHVKNSSNVHLYCFICKATHMFTDLFIHVTFGLVGLMLNVLDNSYDHVGTVRSPYHTFFLGKLD